MSAAKRKAAESMNFDNIDDILQTRKRSRKKGKAKESTSAIDTGIDHSVEVTTDAALKQCTEGPTEGCTITFPEDLSAFGDPGSLYPVLKSIKLKEDEGRMKTWKDEELSQYGATRAFQSMLSALHTAQRMEEMRSELVALRGERTTLRSKLEQSQGLLKKSMDESEMLRSKLKATENLEAEKTALLADKSSLEHTIKSLEEEMQFSKVAAHLKTKHDLFKEFEEHQGSRWNLQEAYQAWEDFLAEDDEGAEGEAEEEERTEERGGAADGGTEQSSPR